LNGGQDGMGPFIEITLPDGTKEHLFKMRARGFPAGTVVETMTGGGGGNGNPKARPFGEVLADVQAGYLTRDAAWSQYGVRITEALVVDAAASEPRV
jgi:N-methylhydantoinase B